RDGDLTLFAGLVMKANWGVNGLARIHCITPTIDRLATVTPDVQFEPSGQFTVRADQVQVQFMHANEPPEGPHQALAGEVLPIAFQPNVKEPNLVDTPYTGYANFYALHYLKYLIGMNTTRPEYGNAQSYDLKLPQGFRGSHVYDFISGKDLPVQNGVVQVGPRSTVALLVGASAESEPPMATRLIMASPEAGGIRVRWQHSGGAIRYIVKRAPSASGPYAQIGQTNGENSFLDTTAKADDVFFYKVAGAGEHGMGLDSPYAPIALASPELLAWLERPALDAAALPEAVPGLAGENVKKTVNLGWKIARRGWTYDVLRATSETGPFAPVATGLTREQWSQNGLDFGTRYFYTVAAVNRDGVRGPQAKPISFQPVDDTIPAPWKGLDIGDVGAEGSDGLLGGIFTLHASGGDVWGSADAFHFVYQPLNGDGTLVAHVAEEQNTNEWVKAGLMLRETLDMGAKNAFVFNAPGHGIVLQTRTGTNGATNGTPDRSGFGAMPWLKLTRAGDTLTAFASRDGQAWTQIGSANIPMQKAVYAGLAVTSHSKGAISMTRFDNVEVHQP
ncbi:MAG: DUF1349 domain-containing protein, partial [Armatimonadota bacterium]|nr:DUF1349 domain-containing protein [Armatimonadota bacterium]